VCFGADHPALVRRRAEGADLVVVAARVWPAIDPLHGLMAGMRALDTGRCAKLRRGWWW
jgi:hypothetical protein